MSNSSQHNYARDHNRELARLLLLACRFRVPRGEQAHGYLWLRLSHAGQVQVQRAGSDLQVLRGQRNWADYDLHRPLKQRFAATQVQSAKDIFAILEAAALEPIKTQITDAMKLYERNVLKQVTWHP